MLYIGHFSFDELMKNEARHGYFTLIIDAIDRETAVAKFSNHILELRKSEDCFAPLLKVYIEDVIELETIPVEPIVTLFQSSEGSFPKSISVSLPGVIKDGIDAFGLPENVNKHEKESPWEYKKSDPFISFEDLE
jgi:hypothetical protein